eukprot:5005239-Amphidinium_carterae.1
MCIRDRPLPLLLLSSSRRIAARRGDPRQRCKITPTMTSTLVKFTTVAKELDPFQSSPHHPSLHPGLDRTEDTPQNPALQFSLTLQTRALSFTRNGKRRQHCKTDSG